MPIVEPTTASCFTLLHNCSFLLSSYMWHRWLDAVDGLHRALTCLMWLVQTYLDRPTIFPVNLLNLARWLGKWLRESIASFPPRAMPCWIPSRRGAYIYIYIYIYKLYVIYSINIVCNFYADILQWVMSGKMMMYQRIQLLSVCTIAVVVVIVIISSSSTVVVLLVFHVFYWTGLSTVVLTKMLTLLSMSCTHTHRFALIFEVNLGINVW